MKPKMVPLKHIVIDPRLQMRAAIDQEAVADYADSLEDLPPAKGVLDSEGRVWLWDGHHCYLAYQKKNRNEMPVDITPGEFLNALQFAAGANAGHSGIRRTIEDKRIAVSRVLTEPEFAEWSDRYVADICQVSPTFVGTVRIEVCASKVPQVIEPQDESATVHGGQLPETDKPKPPKRKGKDGKSRPVPEQPVITADGKILCKRCNRVGVVPDCPKCAEARATAGRKIKPKGSKKGPKAKSMTWQQFDRSVAALIRFASEKKSAPLGKLLADLLTESQKWRST